jgi:hypothetical protein
LGEVSADVGFGCGPGQVAHEQFVFHIIFCLLGLPTPHCPFPTFGFRFAVLTTVNSPDYCGACLLLWLFSETNLTANETV